MAGLNLSSMSLSPVPKLTRRQWRAICLVIKECAKNHGEDVIGVFIKLVPHVPPHRLRNEDIVLLAEHVRKGAKR